MAHNTTAWVADHAAVYERVEARRLAATEAAEAEAAEAEAFDDGSEASPELIARESAARDAAHAALALMDPVRAALNGWLGVHAPALRAA